MNIFKYADVIPFNMNRRPHTPFEKHIIYQRKVVRHLPRILRAGVMDDALCAVVSKVIANTLCYPVESVRLWNISKTTLSYTVPNMFAGYKMYLPYTVMNNVITYALFYTVDAFYKQNIIALGPDATLLLTSLTTCLITSSYKVPVSYVLKRTVVQTDVNINSLANVPYILKAYRAYLMEDIPELFLKFYIRNYIAMNYIGMNAFIKAFVIGLITTILVAPLDIYKTKIICHGMDIRNNPIALAIRIANSLLNTVVFFYCIDLLKITAFLLSSWSNSNA